jgi:hypothetical protein
MGAELLSQYMEMDARKDQLTRAVRRSRPPLSTLAITPRAFVLGNNRHYTCPVHTVPP